MDEVITIGLDLAKSVFQVHGVDAAGRTVLRRALRRKEVVSFFAALPPTLIGMEACGTAHYWARELTRLGHQVKLMPPAYVKAYVKRGKTDAADAEAICEAVRRPTMRFVPVKTKEAQSVLALHRARDLLVRQRTQASNQMRSLLAEFGLVAAKGLGKVEDLAARALSADEAELPATMKALIETLHAHVETFTASIAAIGREIKARADADAAAQRLKGVPGLGVLIASAVAASLPDPSRFANGRHFAAFLGLTPKQHSSGGKTRLLGISKKGDGYLRRLFTLGAVALMRVAARRNDRLSRWIVALRQRRPGRVVATALANKLARIAWAVMAKETPYRVEAA